MELDRQTAMLDLENRSFEPPLYGALALTQIGEADVSFAKETSDVSIQGSLDRVSGDLSLNTMIPSERKKLEAGEGVYNPQLDERKVCARSTDVLGVCPGLRPSARKWSGLYHYAEAAILPDTAKAEFKAAWEAL